MSVYFYRALLVFYPWTLGVVVDYFCHKAGLSRGPWRWKWSLATMGIIAVVALWLWQQIDPHLFDP